MNVLDLDSYNTELITINDPIHIDNEDNYYCSLNYNNSVFNVKTNHVCYSFRSLDNIDNKNYILISLGKDYALFFQELYNILINLIFIKSESWFEETLSLSEIENSFIFPLKSNIEKGTYDIKSFLDMNTFFVKDNKNNTMSIESLLNREILPNFHIKGILFNSKTFTLDIEVKSVLLVDIPPTTDKLVYSEDKSNVKNDEDKEELSNDDEVNDETDEEDIEINETVKDLLENKRVEEEVLENKDLEEYNINNEMLEVENDIMIDTNIYNDVCIFIEDNIKNEIKKYIQNILNNKKVKVNIDLEESLFGKDEDDSLLDTDDENV